MTDLYARMFAEVAAAAAVLLCGWIAGQLRDDHLTHQHQLQLDHTFRRSTL